MTGRRVRRPPGRAVPPGRHAFRPAQADSEHFRLIRLRAGLLLIGLLLAMGGLGGRLISLHIVHARSLERLAERQQFAELVIQPRRGRLLDRWGRPLAINVDAESVYAVPSRIDDPAAFARTVAPILGQRPADVAARLRPDRHFVWLARRVPARTAQQLRSRAAHLGEAIGFLPEARREYPNGTLAAHILGFAGVDNQGLAGAEFAFERFLRGRAGLAHIERDAMGRPRFETRTVVVEPTDGADVVLTIDQVIQHIAERELDRALEATRATWGAALVMEPRTGEILAMATSPRFDPNDFERATPAEWNNPILTRVYEPGSTFKIVLAAAALDAGVTDERQVFTNNGTYKVAGYTIREAHNRIFPRQTLRDIIRNSSNVGAAMVATRLGAEAFHATIRRLGFGLPTGLELPGEAAGLVPPPEQWGGAKLQTIGFGQGISATPLQVLVAAAALANDGLVVRPHILRAVRDAEGRALEVTSVDPGRPAVAPGTARKVMAMMVDAVARGTGTLAELDGYLVAGKTGTAQKPAPSGGYLPDAYIASFLGIVPADRPRLAILVLLDEPKGEYYGGVVAAPVFRAIARQALWHLRVAPSTDAVVVR
ncbi:MAG: penicillin-binding protein 2 [Armatimonadota bacterium]|nr:penicillin-binding protein 2 [Armatimonadota bacterium]